MQRCMACMVHAAVPARLARLARRLQADCQVVPLDQQLICHAAMHHRCCCPRCPSKRSLRNSTPTTLYAASEGPGPGRTLAARPNGPWPMAHGLWCLNPKGGEARGTEGSIGGRWTMDQWEPELRSRRRASKQAREQGSVRACTCGAKLVTLGGPQQPSRAVFSALEPAHRPSPTAPPPAGACRPCAAVPTARVGRWVVSDV